MARPYTYSAVDNGCVLVEIPRNLVPFVTGALRTLERRWYWASDDDYRRAMTALNDMRGQCAMGCAADIVAAIEKQTRLLDRVLNGTEYTETDGVIAPAVPELPNAPAESEESLAANIRRLVQLGENAATGAAYATSANGAGVPLDAAGGWSARLQAVQGVKDAGWFGGGTPVTLSDLYRRDGVTGEDDEGVVNDAIQEVLGTLAAGGSVGDALATLFSTAVDATTDGGVVATTIAAAAATAAASAAQLQGLQALVTELRFYNRALFGMTGAEPTLPLPNNLWSETFYNAYPTETTRRPLAELVRKGLMTETTGIFGDPIRPQFLAELMRHNLYDDDYAAFRQQELVTQNLTRDVLGQLNGQPYSASDIPAVGGISKMLWEILYNGSMPGQSGGPLTGRELAAAIAVATRDAADCCEEGSGGGEPAPAPDPSDCGSGFTSVSAVSEYVAGDYSGPSASSEGLAIVPGAGASITDVAAPWAPSRRAFRVTSGASAYMCLQVTTAPGDDGVYGVGIAGYLSDGSPAFTPGGFAQNFPPASSYTSVLIAEDSGGFDVYWYLTVYRVDTLGGTAAPYSGPPPRIFLTEGTLS